MRFLCGNFYSELLGIDACNMIRSRTVDTGVPRGSGIETRLWLRSYESINCAEFISFSLSYLVNTERMSEEECPIPISERKPRFVVTKYIPVLNWLPRYTRLKAVSDLIAGITVGLTMIPQSMAYAVLAERIPQVSYCLPFLLLAVICVREN